MLMIIKRWFRLEIILLTTFTVLCLIASSWAQVASPFSNGNGPIDIQSDSLEISEDRNTAIFRGEVIAVQDSSTLKAKELQVNYANRTNPETGQNEQAVETLLARGKVILVLPDQTVTGDWGHYDLATEIIIMRGNVVVEKPDTVLTGGEFVADLATGVSKVFSDTSNRVNLQLKAGGETAPE